MISEIKLFPLSVCVCAIFAIFFCRILFASHPASTAGLEILIVALWWPHVRRNLFRQLRRIFHMLASARVLVSNPALTPRHTVRKS